MTKRKTIMTRQTRRRILTSLIYVLLIILSVDGLLYHLDPLGLVAARHAQATYASLMQPDATGYRLQTGIHRIHNYTMTVLPDGTRAVPDTNRLTRCTLAVIGDSVTQGIGVDDNVTWVNRLAFGFPDVQLLNTGRSDYSLPDILQLQTAYPADGYVYLMIENDVLDEFLYAPLRPDANLYPPALSVYLRYALLNTGETRRQPARVRFMRSLSRLAARPDTLVFAFDSPDLPLSRTVLATLPGVVGLPPYTSRLSYVDGHPDPQGHAQIAAAMRPYVIEFIDDVCP